MTSSLADSNSYSNRFENMSFLPIFLLSLLGLALAGPLTPTPALLSGDFVPMKKIPNTNLYTGIFYKMGMKKFPEGWITWTDLAAQDKTGNYMQIDINPKNLPYYKPGEKWFKDIQWMLEPTEKDGLFVMRNKASPSSLVYSKVEKEGGYRHVIVAKDPAILSKLSPSGELRDEALLKPVMTDDKSEYKYQIKFHKYPKGTMTWTDTKYGDYSKYIQLSENPGHQAKYEKGKEWWDDTLYSFLPEAERLSLSGFISHIELTEENEKILDKYGKHVKTTEKKGMTLINPDAEKKVENVTISMKEVDSTQGTMQIKEKVPFEISAKFKIPSLKMGEAYTIPKLLIEGAKDASNIAVKVKNTVDITRELVIPPKAKIEIRVVTHMLEKVELPFRALVVIAGEGDRMSSDHSTVKKGPMPPEMVMDELKKKGIEERKMKVIGDKVMMWVTGTLKGDFNIGTDIIV